MVVEKAIEIASDEWEILSDFRNRCYRLGDVFSHSYKGATIALFDYYREKAGGIPKNSFLLAAKEEDDGSIMLLRVMDEALLPNAGQNDIIRQQGLDESGGDKPWASELDPWTRDRLSLHGLECRVLGTFLYKERRYAEDIPNYHAVHELMVWKPDSAILEIIVNHRHRANDIGFNPKPQAVGRTRFAAAEPKDSISAEFRLNPTDIMKRRTVYFGMSRSGKSNGLKLFAESVYRLRELDQSFRVGQLIFDVNGEYAQDNSQDEKGLHSVHESIGRPRDEEVTTYGLVRPVWDKQRRMMRINFFGNSIPRPWTTETVEIALDEMIAGKTIINEMMSRETARYTSAFRDADLAIPANTDGDADEAIGAQTRYCRSVLAYRAALAAAGLEPPDKTASLRAPKRGSLLGKELVKALSLENNEKSDNKTEYSQAARFLSDANDGGFDISWDKLIRVFTILNKFINDKKSGYDKFEQEKINDRSRSGESWADPRFKAILRIFESQNGPRLFQTAREQHDPSRTIDFAEQVVEDLRDGKLVIIDQSGGDPRHNEIAAERIMWRLFETQQDLFKNRMMNGQSAKTGRGNGHVIAYIEEAHNLLPSRSTSETLRSVWARSAKEGSKYNLGIVLATQAPSSIMSEILSETDNWIVAYLNSAKERRVVSDYMDFQDFEEQIGSVSEQGFVRIRTLSQAYTVPVQLKKFELDEIDQQDGATANGSRNGNLNAENIQNQMPL